MNLSKVSMDRTQKIDFVLFNMAIHGISELHFNSEYDGENLDFSSASDRFEKEISENNELLITTAEELLNELMETNELALPESANSMIHYTLSTCDNYSLKIEYSYYVSGEGEGSETEEEELEGDLYEALNNSEATKIIIRFDGGGDSGGITEEEYYQGKKEIQHAWDPALHKKTISALEDIIYRACDPNFNNEGCRGHATIVKRRKKWYLSTYISFYEDQEESETLTLSSSQTLADLTEAA